MTITTDEKTEKSPTLRNFLKKHALFLSIFVILSLIAGLVSWVEDKNEQKWEIIKTEHPTLRVNRYNQSNLLTTNYTVIKIDGELHISVPDDKENGSSYSYSLSDINIYEVLK